MFGGKKRTLLQKAIDKGEVNENLRDRIDALPDNYEVGTAGDMQAVGEALSSVSLFPANSFRGQGAGVRALVRLCQQITSHEAADAFRDAVVPQFVRLYDLAVSQSEYEDDLLMFMLKQLAMISTDQGTDCLARAIRRPELSEKYIWSIIFSILSDERHQSGMEIILKLADPIPDNFAAIALLDGINQIAIDRGIDHHPFDTPEGAARLRSWLSDTDPNHFSYAVSSTAALPFISGPVQRELLEIATRHPDADVRLEALWAAGKSGDANAIEQLVEACADPNYATKAAHYLEELGFSDAVPDAVREPGFAARAEMSAWLQHPSEFGRVPDELSLYDHRTIYWPPTGERLPVWLLRYVFKSDDPREEPDEIGIGMVGSVTFALFGEATDGLPPEEVYGLHCCWEMQCLNHPDAPEERDGKAGWAMIQAGEG